MPQGHVFEFTMESKDSKIYPGIAREPNTFAGRTPRTPSKLIVNSHPAPYTRRVAVYVPKQYVPGTEAPFIVGADGPDRTLFTALDNLIAEKRVPVMIAISIGNGSGDAQGSQRGLEYDTMSGLYAEFVEKEVLPLVEKQYNVKLTKDPEGRATMGCSSGGAAAMAMAWYRTDLYHRVLSYSGTFVYQQWPYNPETPHGAWEFHETLIPNSPKKPLRIWMHVSDGTFSSPATTITTGFSPMSTWPRLLAAKGYPYQFVFAKNAGHCDRGVKAQTLPLALEYVWQGYRRRSEPAARDFLQADLPGLIQKLIIPTDQRRSKPLQMTGLSLDVRLQRVSAAVEILPRPHGLAARLRNVHWNQIFDCGSQLERGELRSAWQRHRHVHMV